MERLENVLKCITWSNCSIQNCDYLHNSRVSIYFYLSSICVTQTNLRLRIDLLSHKNEKAVKDKYQ